MGESLFSRREQAGWANSPPEGGGTCCDSVPAHISCAESMASVSNHLQKATLEFDNSVDLTGSLEARCSQAQTGMVESGQIQNKLRP